jgi:hypothetical protein
MYYTHHFAHRETLSRARSWLVKLGFQPHEIQASVSGIPRLVVAVPSDRREELQMLINAVERTDPDGFPSFWEMARPSLDGPGEAEPFVPAPEPSVPEPKLRHETVIGWHPPDRAVADDPELTAIRESMGQRLGLF